MMEKSRSALQTFLPIIVLAVLVLGVGAYDHTFFSLGNFLSVTADTMTLFLMASGVTLVIMMGGIDLSVQAVASMTSCILAAYLPRSYWPFTNPADSLAYWKMPESRALGFGSKVMPIPNLCRKSSSRAWAMM